MMDAYDLLQSELVEAEPSYKKLADNLRDRLHDASAIEPARLRALIRTCEALEARHVGQASAADLVVLLRQIMRSHVRRLEVPLGLWDQLRDYAYRSGIRQAGDPAGNCVELVADVWQPTWLQGTADIDHLEQRRRLEPSQGDGILAAMTGYSTYQSAAQKAAVAAWLFAARASTTLVTLPTGAGKSLVATLPAWQSSLGGQVAGGTTVVVVPTVALALDQEAQARRIFASTARDEEHMPACLIGSTGGIRREIIRNGLRTGTLPLLFTSPEALLSAHLHTICVEAARDRYLTRLVIDEAHLVESWGAGFRTEFQFLSAFRRRLLDATGGALRTLLLSATITQTCEEVLAGLFAPVTGLTRVRANGLRPEPAYWFNVAPDATARGQRVLDALAHLPRPAILYLTQPEQADSWHEVLVREGYTRMATFTGNTSAGERARRMSDWSEDRCDIMIATSAFGVGVDKPDVRTVLHACLPENIDRFYQEVGRGGRDGCTSTSLTCVAPGDEGIAEGMTSSARITVPVAWERWRGMIQGQHYLGTRGDEVLLDTDAVPADRPDLPQSQLNREWNEHVLLLLSRAGLIELSDVWPEEDPGTASVTDVATETDATPTAHPSNDKHSMPRTGVKGRGALVRYGAPSHLHVRILLAAATGDQDAFARALGSVRDIEFARVRLAMSEMRELVATYAGNQRWGTSSGPEANTHPICIAKLLAVLYPMTAHACGGCSACRAEATPPYANQVCIETELVSDAPAPPIGELHTEIRGDLGPLLSGRGVLVVHWDHQGSMPPISLAEALADTVGVGFAQLVVGDDLLQHAEWAATLTKRLARHRGIPHLVLPASWLLAEAQYPLFTLPTLIAYPTDDAAADVLYRVVRRRFNARGGPPIMHVVRRRVYLQSEHGRFLDRVEGLTVSLERLQEVLRATHEATFF